MMKILFVCHGNICRSPMAEFVMKNLLLKENIKDVEVDSKAATSDAIHNGIGMPMDVRTRRVLDKNQIPYTAHQASLMTKDDYNKYDYLICMDEENFMDMNRISGGDPERKEYKLLHFIGKNDDIDDPWYTGDFDESYREIMAGCKGLLKEIKK
ncbi:low molecular weight protein-tyrosine-phosphatase [Lactobacillus sp. PSON]|uniref:low molecular weight protein-tyrosine-phosphatase n=1 Tax=Lactobacillus sp. PSON TaxID=3455454 RepID=UPI00404246E4